MDGTSEALEAAAVWAGLLVLLLIVLAFLVVRQRQAHKVTLGHGDVPSLEQASRVFGNAIEYVPAGIAGLTLMALVGGHPSAIHAVGASLLLGRVLHAFGLSRTAGVSAGRAAGSLLTWLALILIGTALIGYALT
jgi:uncharacterized membrane protein YecN with MAPEG domain